VDSDYAGDVNMDEQLITKSFNFTNLADVSLSFNHYFRHWASEKGYVDVSINGGAWQNVKKYRGASRYGLVELALSSFGADDSCNVQMRWHYYNARDCWYWGIDDVQISAAEDVPVVSVQKCTVTAGSKDNADRISISGQLRATIYDINDINVINITVYSDDINKPLDISFPVDANTFKKNKFSYSKTIDGVRKSFTYDPKTRKYSFSASNVDLSGLDCPVTVKIVIDDYNAITDVYETIVNGTRTPIPMKLMTLVKDVLRVEKPYDRLQIRQMVKTDPCSYQLTVRGAFAIDNNDVNMVSQDLVITLGAQQFTIPKESLKAGKGKFTCSRARAPVNEGGSADAAFNYNTCTFTLTIRKTNIDTISGKVDFGVKFAGFDEKIPVVLPF
jgi:hypothetical protein